MDPEHPDDKSSFAAFSSKLRRDQESRQTYIKEYHELRESYRRKHDITSVTDDADDLIADDAFTLLTAAIEGSLNLHETTYQKRLAKGPWRLSLTDYSFHLVRDHPSTTFLRRLQSFTKVDTNVNSGLSRLFQLRTQRMCGKAWSGFKHLTTSRSWQPWDVPECAQLQGVPKRAQPSDVSEHPHLSPDGLSKNVTVERLKKRSSAEDSGISAAHHKRPKPSRHDGELYGHKQHAADQGDHAETEHHVDHEVAAENDSYADNGVIPPLNDLDPTQEASTHSACSKNPADGREGIVGPVEVGGGNESIDQYHLDARTDQAVVAGSGTHNLIQPAHAHPLRDAVKISGSTSKQNHVPLARTSTGNDAADDDVWSPKAGRGGFRDTKGQTLQGDEKPDLSKPSGVLEEDETATDVTAELFPASLAMNTLGFQDPGFNALEYASASELSDLGSSLSGKDIFDQQLGDACEESGVKASAPWQLSVQNPSFQETMSEQDPGFRTVRNFLEDGRLTDDHVHFALATVAQTLKENVKIIPAGSIDAVASVPRKVPLGPAVRRVVVPIHLTNH